MVDSKINVHGQFFLPDMANSSSGGERPSKIIKFQKKKIFEKLSNFPKMTVFWADQTIQNAQSSTTSGNRNFLKFGHNNLEG